MPTLLPEVARVIAGANRRAAAAVDEEVTETEQLRARVDDWREISAGYQALHRHLTRALKADIGNVSASATELKELWAEAVKSLRTGMTADEQLTLFHVFKDLAGSGHLFLDPVDRFRALIERLVGSAEGAEKLAEARQVFDRILSDATRALHVRTTQWPPADPARFTRGLEEARTGQAIGPDEAKSRLRNP